MVIRAMIAAIVISGSFLFSFGDTLASSLTTLGESDREIAEDVIEAFSHGEEYRETQLWWLVPPGGELPGTREQVREWGEEEVRECMRSAFPELSDAQFADLWQQIHENLVNDQNPEGHVLSDGPGGLQVNSTVP